jgi:hypothetical protein
MSLCILEPNYTNRRGAEVAIVPNLHSTHEESFPHDSEQVTSNPVHGTTQQNYADSNPQFIYIA